MTEDEVKIIVANQMRQYISITAGMITEVQFIITILLQTLDRDGTVDKEEFSNYLIKLQKLIEAKDIPSSVVADTISNLRNLNLESLEIEANNV